MKGSGCRPRLPCVQCQRAPLALPKGLGREALQIAVVDGVASLLDERQVEDGFLDVGREPQEIHDLRHPRAADADEAGQGGLVHHDASVDEPLPAVREREHPGDPGHPPGGRRGRHGGPDRLQALPTPPGGVGCHL